MKIGDLIGNPESRRLKQSLKNLKKLNSKSLIVVANSILNELFGFILSVTTQTGSPQLKFLPVKPKLQLVTDVDATNVLRILQTYESKYKETSPNFPGSQLTDVMDWLKEEFHIEEEKTEIAE